MKRSCCGLPLLYLTDTKYAFTRKCQGQCGRTFRQQKRLPMEWGQEPLADLMLMAIKGDDLTERQKARLKIHWMRKRR